MNSIQSAVFISIALFFWLVSPILAQSELSGHYNVEGANPGGGGKYRGKVSVALTGDTYQVVWRIGKSNYRGTGILESGVFSVVYKVEGTVAGIAVYKVKTNGSLTGRWAGLAGVRLGIEVWKPDKGI